MENQPTNPQNHGREIKKITWSYIEDRIADLASKIDAQLYDGLFGVPRGGVPVALSLSKKLNIPVVDCIGPRTLICDDICDSGATLGRFEENDAAVIFCRDSSRTLPKYFSEITEDWISFPWEIYEQPAEDAINRILQYLGENPKREGLLDTPKRVIKSYRELFSGYKEDPAQVLGTSFDSAGYNQIIILKNIEMYSTCEHHMIPFVGSVSIGYIPGNRVVGLSKLARLVEVFARRLQIQEKLTEQIAEAIMENLLPQGCMVIVKAKHFCMCARGVNKQNSWMVTSAIRGRFEEHPVRQEFLSLINLE